MIFKRRCRVQSGDRSIYSELVDTVVVFVEEQVAEGQALTLRGESFGGLLTAGIAQRFVKNEMQKLTW